MSATLWCACRVCRQLHIPITSLYYSLHLLFSRIFDNVHNIIWCKWCEIASFSGYFEMRRTHDDYNIIWLTDQKSCLLLMTYLPVVTRHEPQFIKQQPDRTTMVLLLRYCFILLKLVLCLVRYYTMDNNYRCFAYSKAGKWNSLEVKRLNYYWNITKHNNIVLFHVGT